MIKATLIYDPKKKSLVVEYDNDQGERSEIFKNIGSFDEAIDVLRIVSGEDDG